MNPSLLPTDILPDPQNFTLLVIDVQERLTPAMPADVMPGVLRSTRILIETAAEFNRPILVSEQYPKGLGLTVAEIKTTLPVNAVTLEKVAFSCCREDQFLPFFDIAPGHNFILCGMETHVCVLQTALDLVSQGQRVLIAADAVCSRTALNHQLGLDLMRQAGAVIGSAEIFAFGLLRAAGIERFKRISRLVK